jgi:single-strand DNA-binding protein
MPHIPYKNQVILCGNIGNEPVIRTLNNGESVMSLRVATNHSWKDVKGEWQTTTEWHTCVCYREWAERAAHYKKGDCLHIEGRIYTREWLDEKQKKHSSREIIVNNHHLLLINRSAEDTKELPVSADEFSDKTAFSDDVYSQLM